MKKFNPHFRLILAAFLITAASLHSNAQPSGWSYLQSISITENSGTTLTDYQVKLTVNTQAYITAGQMNADGSDIRFGTDCNGSTLLPYFIESGINTPTTVIWVRVPSLPANAVTSIYMYFGNISVTGTGQYQTVFDGPNSSTDSVSSGGAGGVGNSQRGFHFSANEDVLVSSFGKDEPTGTTRYVTLFDYNSQAMITQLQVSGAAGEYHYADLATPIWLTQGTEYVLELYQDVNDGYYFGGSTQIGQAFTYLDMRYCNSCTQNTFPTNVLNNYQYGYPDLWYYTRQHATVEPTYTLGAIGVGAAVDLGGPYVQCAGSVTLDAGGSVLGTNFSEGLDAGTSGVTYTPAGWVQQNNSTTVGVTQWFGGNAVVFPSHSGAGYIAANYNSTTNSDDISNWLMTQNFTLQNGDVFSFWTRTTPTPAFPDRLQVRMSTNGASTNVGAGPAAVGDFTTLLLDINPTLTTVGYPNAWTQYSVTISGLSGPTSGRLAFRYYVTNGGPSGVNSDYIGIDDVLYSSTLTPSVYAWSTGSTNKTITVNSTGTYTVTVTGGACPATGSASLTINIPPVVNLGGPYTQCGGTVTLDAGYAGSSYNWSTGDNTQTIAAGAGSFSVTVTDINTCTGIGTASVNINPFPTVNLGGPYAQCGGTVTLDAGNAGSTYNWSTGDNTQTIAAGSGSFSVTVTDANTCTGSGSANVNIFPIPSVDLGGPYAQCAGTVTLDATDIYLSYAWSDGITTTQTFTTGSTGTYSVTVSDDNGCTGTGSANVTIYTPPVVNLGGPYVACVSILLDAGHPGSSYIWSNGVTNTQTLLATTTGIYSVTVTDIHTCTGSASADVTIHLPPLNETGYTICQGLTVPAGEGLTASGCGDVSSSFVGTTSLSDPTFIRSVTGTTYNASGIGTAVHYTTHTFAVGTTGSYTFSSCGYDTYLHIYQGSFNPAFPATNFLVADDDGNNGVCPGGSKATITLTAGVTYIYVATGFGNSDVGSYTVTFTGPGSVYEGPLNSPLWFSSAVGGPLVATGSPFNPVGTATLPNTNTPGTYTFYTACPNTPDCRKAINFVVNPTPVVNLGGPYNQCGGSVPLNAGPGNTSYSWSDGTSAQTTVATTSGTYTVTVANSFNCSATGTTEVYIQSVPVVNLGLDVTQCGGSVTLDAGNPGNVYLWSDQSTGQTLTVNATGVYSVTVGDINSNCTASDDVSVTINQAPVVDLGSDVVQCGGVVTLDANNPGATYLWSDNSTNQTLTVSASGIYRVTVTNSTGCTGTGAVNITINSYPTLGADKTDSVCPGYTVDLYSYYASSGYASYIWFTPDPSHAGAGVYQLIVTNAAGCADTAIATIINRLQPNLGPDLTDSICIGYTYDLWTLYPPSPAYVTYVWNTPTPSSVTAGTYALIVTNASGCSDTLNAVITNRQQPNLGPDKADSVCMGYTLDLTTYYPNTGYETYVWNTATPDSVGPGVYTLIVSNASGCYDTAVMTVTYRQQPIVTLNMPLAMCYTEPPFVLTGGMPAGGTYVVGDSLNVDTFSAVLFGIGIHHITYIYTNSSGCTDSASIDFTVSPQPHITTDTAPNLCTGSSPMNLNNYFKPLGGVYVGFGVSQNYFYPALTGAGPDTITYYYTDQFGCKDTSVYPISVKNSVHVSLVSSDVDFTICQRDNITFTASGAEFYLFFVNGIAQDTVPSLSNIFSTNSLNNHDQVYVIGSNSCSADTSEPIVIDVITLPTVDAGPDTTIALGQIVILHTKATGTGLLIYDWTPNYYLNFANVPNPTYSGPDTVNFVVKVTDTYGCWATDSITVNVYIPDNVLLPNLITPDGDGKNDTWKLNYKINLDGSNLVIFNRWGETVYEVSNYTNDWDGTYKATGKKLPDDTYYYVLKVPAQNNHIYKGAINILNGTAK